MNDKQLSRLFADYNPSLTSDHLFMEQFQRNMRAVRYVKEHTAVLHRKNRIAMVVAAATGFVCGVIFTLCYPLIADYIAGLATAGTAAALLLADFAGLIAWAVISLATLLATYTAYNLTPNFTPKPILN